MPNCSCLCSSCFIALLYFHHSVSMGYFVSSGILSLLLCGFLTSTCFKIPCCTLSKNVRPGGVTADTSGVTQLVWVAAHVGFSAFSKPPTPCHPFLVINRGAFAPPPTEYLAVSRDIFGCCNLERCYWYLTGSQECCQTSQNTQDSHSNKGLSVLQCQ